MDCYDGWGVSLKYNQALKLFHKLSSGHRCISSRLDQSIAMFNLHIATLLQSKAVNW